MGMIKNIAVIKGSSIGDIITGIPMLRNLSKKYPGAKITLVASYRGAGEPLIKRCHYIDEYVVMSGQTVKKILYLRGKKFDLVINGYPATFRSSILSLLLGGKITACVKGREMVFGYDIVVDPSGMDATEAENKLLEELGIRAKDTELELFVNMDLAGKNVGRLISSWVKRKKIIVCNIGKDGNFNRTWVTEKWAEFINRFGDGYGFIFIGAADNSENSKAVEKLVKKGVCNLVGRLSVDETAYVISICDLFVCINGGPMHIAAALKKPVVALHGPSYPQWNPHAKKAINLGGRKLCNNRCDDNFCAYGDARCIKSLSSEDVYRSAMRLLEKGHSRSP